MNRAIVWLLTVFILNPVHRTEAQQTKKARQIGFLCPAKCGLSEHDGFRDAMRQLGKLPWPGNISQLRRVLTETVARQRSGVITADKLPPECRSVTRRKLTQMEALERDAIVRSLQDNGGNKQEAARALGMSRATIYRKINDYGIA